MRQSGARGKGPADILMCFLEGWSPESVAGKKTGLKQREAGEADHMRRDAIKTSHMGDHMVIL